VLLVYLDNSLNIQALLVCPAMSGPANSVVRHCPVLQFQSTRLQKEMATYRHWSVSLWRDPDDVSHCHIINVSICLISWNMPVQTNRVWLPYFRLLLYCFLVHY